MPPTIEGGFRRLGLALPRWALDYATSGWIHFLEPFYRVIPLGMRGGRPETPDIVLIPGVNQTWIYLSRIADTLNERGYRIHAIPDLGHNRGHIGESAQTVREEMARRGITNAYLVAHSKGGLIGKKVLVDALRDETAGVDAPRVLGMTAISTPFHGSSYAQYMPSPVLRRFRPGNPTIVSLEEARQVNARIVSLYGRFDPHIPESSHLDGAAANLELPVTGHMRILRDTLCVAVIVAVTQRACEAAIASS